MPELTYRLPTDEPVFVARGVTAGYRRADGTPAAIVRCADWQVAEGERWALRGPSGSGKSTWLRLLNRFEDPLEGALSYRGRELTEWDPVVLRREVMLVGQVPVMFDGSVADNLAAVPRDLQAPDRQVQLTALERVDLPGDVLQQPARQLSVGQQQRVALARAVLREPAVLLLDEPTASLDQATATALIRTLLALGNKSDGLTMPSTIVFASHDPVLIAELATRTATIRDGRLEEEGRNQRGSEPGNA